MLSVDRLSIPEPGANEASLCLRPSKRAVALHHGCNGVWRPLLSFPVASRCLPVGVPVPSRWHPSDTPKKGLRKTAPFAPAGRIVGRMPMSKKELDSFRRDIARGPYRPPLFWWLLEHYDELTAEHASTRQDWISHCKRMAGQGVVDARGQTPSCETARKAWQKVRKEVAAGRVKRPGDTVPPTPPSRQRADWQPPVADADRTIPALRYRRDDLEEEPPARRSVALPPSQAPPSFPPVGANSSASLKQEEELSPHAEAQLKKLDLLFAKTDRKRFGSF